MLEWIEALALKEVAEYIAVTIGVISLLVEWNKKIPWHPWSSMFAWIGKQFTKGIDEKIERLNKQIQDTAKAVEDLHNEMEHRFDENEKNDDDKEMKRLRASIIQFSDDCGRHIHHTKVHFENIFRDIDDYKRYCEKHNFPNHFIDGEVAYISSVYKQCLEENRFLLLEDEEEPKE